MSFNWDVIQEMLGWDDESMGKLKIETERISKEYENEGQEAEQAPQR